MHLFQTAAHALLALLTVQAAASPVSEASVVAVEQSNAPALSTRSGWFGGSANVTRVLKVSFGKGAPGIYVPNYTFEWHMKYNVSTGDGGKTYAAHGGLNKQKHNTETTHYRWLGSHWSDKDAHHVNGVLTGLFEHKDRGWTLSCTLTWSEHFQGDGGYIYPDTTIKVTTTDPKGQFRSIPDASHVHAYAAARPGDD